MVRNESPQARWVHINYYNMAHAGGGYAYEQSTLLNPGQQWVTTPSMALHGSAVVDGGEDLSVAVSVRRNPVPNYISAAHAGTPPIRMASTAYVPMVMRQKSTGSGIGNSDLYIQNAGSSNLYVAVDLIASPGSGLPNYTTPLFNIPPSATQLYSLQNENPGFVPNEWIGSAVVRVVGVAGNINVLSNLKFGAATIQSLQGFSPNQASSAWSIPLFTSRLNNGLSTPVTIQNLSGATFGTNSIGLSCTPMPGSSGNITVTNGAQTVPNNGYIAFNPVVDLTLPSNWQGSCRLTAPGPAVVFVQMRYVGAGNTANAAAYEAAPSSGAARQIVFPLIQKRLGDGSATTATVQNLSQTTPTYLTFYYFGAPGFGNYVLYSSSAVQPGAAVTHNHRLTDLGIGDAQIPDGWNGSLVVVSDGQPIDGFSQITNLNMHSLPGDLFQAYKGITP